MKRILLFLLLVTISSCLKENQKITPLSDVQSLSASQRELLIQTANQIGQSAFSDAARATLQMSHDPSLYYLNVRVKLTDIDVYKTLNVQNIFEQLGSQLLIALARTFLAIKGQMEIDLEDFSFKVPDNLSIDRNVLKSVRVKKIFIKYNEQLDQENDYLGNFHFIENLEILREIKYGNEKKIDALFLSYRKNQNFCLQKCLDFKIMDSEFIDLLTPGQLIKLKPLLNVSSLPSLRELRIDGEIELQIGLKLPF